MWNNNNNGLGGKLTDLHHRNIMALNRSKQQQQQTNAPQGRRIRSAAIKTTQSLIKRRSDPPGSFRVSETQQGVEVSMRPQPQPKAPPEPQPPDVVNVYDFLKKAKRIKKHQFSMNYPLIKNVQTVGGRRSLQSQQHRVQLETTDEVLSLQDMIFVLQSHMVSDEPTSLQQEISKLDAEIRALEDDRTELEHEYLHIRPAATASEGNDVWDIEYLLKQKPSLQDVQELHRLRGNCLTIHVNSNATREAICTKLGLPKKQYKLVGQQASCVTITPTDATDAARYLGQATLWPSTHKGCTSFFLHFLELSQAEGGVPPSLWNRMKKMALQLEMLRYLSSGPNGSYFCIMTSGHCWWKTLDAELDALLCQDWIIHRVAFGECKYVAGVWTQSWIIIGRDGRVAHKNLPKRFANLLDSRLADEPAPDHVSLGSGGAYFVRFLDGSVDYCVPARVARTIDEIVEHGGEITNIMMHPELHDFMVRHTELKKAKRKPKPKSILTDPFSLFTG